MTFGAVEIAPVVERFVCQTSVAVVDRRPGVRYVAEVAVLRRVKVTRIHSRRGSAVVARSTGTDDLVVIDRCHG